MNLKLRRKDKAISLNNPKRIEKIFKDSFGYVKKNDSCFRVPDLKSAAKVTKFRRMQNIPMKKMRNFLFPGY